MANVIMELRQEMARVRRILPQLTPATRQQADFAVTLGEAALATAQYEAIREAIDDLKEFSLPPVLPEGGKS
jgi:hypothetical protein